MADPTSPHAPARRRRTTFRLAPYAVAVSLPVLLYLALILILSLFLRTLFSATDEPLGDYVEVVAAGSLPYLVVAVLLSGLGLVVLHALGGRMHWLGEGVVASVFGIVISLIVTSQLGHIVS